MSDMKKVYLSEKIADSAYERLSARYEVVNTFDDVENIYGIIVRTAKINGDIIRAAKNLKVICEHGVSLDSIDCEAAKECGVPVVNVPGVNSESGAGFAVALMRASARKIRIVDRAVRDGSITGQSRAALVGTELYGKKVGFAGDGNIAGRVRRILVDGFGMEAYCFNPHKSAEQLAEAGYIKVGTLPELFKLCDFVSVHMPITPETADAISWDCFKDANPKLVVVGTSRGRVINEEALYDALTTGKIAAAALDVFAKEPPTPENPLVGLPNFIGTSHIGANTADSLDRVGNIVVDNIIKGIEG